MAGTTLLSFVFMLHLCSRLAWAYFQAVPVIFLWWSQRSKRGSRNKQAYFTSLACVKFATVPLVKSSYTWKGIAKGQEHREVWKDTGRSEKLEPLVKSIYCNNERRVKSRFGYSGLEYFGGIVQRICWWIRFEVWERGMNQRQLLDHWLSSWGDNEAIYPDGKD